MEINKEIKDKFEWGSEREWKERTKIIADILPDGARVIDMGGGFCHLQKYIKNGEYISLDIKPWTDKTIVTDFNRDQFPELLGLYQFIICQGILEYIDNPENFLQKIKKYGKIMILTYRNAKTKTQIEIKNSMAFMELEYLIDQTGWKIIMQKRITPQQRLFYCKKI